ncbi:hypothetical protein BKA80DRAFT_343318 [Phyllosticta citrichinensis]
MARIKRLATKARLSMKRLLKLRQRKTSASLEISTLIDSDAHETSSEHCEHPHADRRSEDYVCLTGDLNDTGNVENQAELPRSRESPSSESFGEADPFQSTMSDVSNPNKAGFKTCESDPLRRTEQQATRITAPRIICPREERSDFFLFGYESDTASNKSATKDGKGANAVNDYDFGGPSHYYGVCTLFRDDRQFVDTETSFELSSSGKEQVLNEDTVKE